MGWVSKIDGQSFMKDFTQCSESQVEKYIIWIVFSIVWRNQFKRLFR